MRIGFSASDAGRRGSVDPGREGDAVAEVLRRCPRGTREGGEVGLHRPMRGEMTRARTNVAEGWRADGCSTFPACSLDLGSYAPGVDGPSVRWGRRRCRE